MCLMSMLTYNKDIPAPQSTPAPIPRARTLDAARRVHVGIEQVNLQVRLTVCGDVDRDVRNLAPRVARFEPRHTRLPFIGMVAVSCVVMCVQGIRKVAPLSDTVKRPTESIGNGKEARGCIYESYIRLQP